jgi:hypothetical protein
MFNTISKSGNFADISATLSLHVLCFSDVNSTFFVNCFALFKINSESVAIITLSALDFIQAS